MEYQIAITYKTGNSFGTHTETERVGCVWTDIDDAKSALRSIKEHHEYCRLKKRRLKKNEPVKGTWFCDEYPEGSLVVYSDGKPVKIHAFWIGWFETLLKAEIVFDDNDLIFEP